MRRSLLLPLLFALLAVTTYAQPVDTLAIGSSGSNDHALLRPIVGAHIGGFPLLMQIGLRGGIDFHDRLVVAIVDFGYVVGGESEWIREINFRGQIPSPLRLVGPDGETYLHGFYRLFGDRGTGYGGGIGFRKMISPHFYGFGELEIAVARTDVEGNRFERVVWFPSLGRMGVCFVY